MHADRVIIHACAHTCILSMHPRSHITSCHPFSSSIRLVVPVFLPFFLPCLLSPSPSPPPHRCADYGTRSLFCWPTRVDVKPSKILLTARAAPLTARAGGIRHEAEEELLHEQYSSRMLFVVHGPHSSCDRRRRRPLPPSTLSSHRPPRLPCSMRARSAQVGGYDI